MREFTRLYRTGVKEAGVGRDVEERRDVGIRLTFFAHVLLAQVAPLDVARCDPRLHIAALLVFERVAVCEPMSSDASDMAAGTIAKLKQGRTCRTQ